jgi:arylsulfatase A-like enzyme
MTRRPHVLFVLVDQWPGKLLRAAGHPAILTPTLDHLARLGTRFPRAYSECPVCIPARRTIMTGTSPATHGDRNFAPALEMPMLPTLAQTFRDGGYQAYAVGKMHVYPQRDRIGFDDIVLAEEGRAQLGAVDDYDLFLAEQGAAGEQYLHGMNNNDYLHRPWHLPERLHVTNWITREAAKLIKRRDPRKPGLWHVSYTHPHPPLVPLESYLGLYAVDHIDAPLGAPWADAELPPALTAIRAHWPATHSDRELKAIRRAFYALCTHIDHQLRVLIGTLREEQLLDETIILLSSDHGDMLGDFGLWAKRLFYESSAQVPMILVGPKGDARVPAGTVDARLIGLQDIMPTLLSLAGLSIPSSVQGLSMVGPDCRHTLYGECMDNVLATRMAHDGRYKLIWYPAGNHVQLFDLESDPNEQHDLHGQAEYAEVEAALVNVILKNAWGTDLAWIAGQALNGFSADVPAKTGDRQFGGQRGLHYPQPPLGDPMRTVGSPG